MTSRVMAAVALVLCAAVAWAQPANFRTSLHATRAGKAHWYDAENGGFESFTNVPIEDMACTQCHGPVDAHGREYPGDYAPGCSDCHAADFGVDQASCYACHGRQKVEALRKQIPDVHRDAGMVCWDCHSTEDLHGDGTEYVSLGEAGAIDSDCSDCHTADSLPAAHAGYDPHSGALHCAACHASTVISCYNCHLESQVETHIKRARAQLDNFVILVNRAKDGKVGPASFQSITYQGDAFVAFGPYTPHTITREGRTCQDCHVNMGGSNESIVEYNATGQIQFAELGDDGSLSWKTGIVPMPADYQQSFKMEFITFDGDVSTPAGQDSMNWSSIGKNTWDGHQMLFSSPLTSEQMARLGMTRTSTAVAEEAGAAPVSFALEQNYPNPFNASTTIPYQVSKPGHVLLEVCDTNGQRVATLIDRSQPAGSYTASWDGTDSQGNPVSTGSYFARLRMGGVTQVSKTILLK